MFDSDSEHFSQCGGALKFIAASEDPTVIAKILAHLGWSSRGTPPIIGAAIRSIPNGLIPNRYPIPSGSAPEPEPTILLGPRSRQTPQVSNVGT